MADNEIDPRDALRQARLKARDEIANLSTEGLQDEEPGETDGSTPDEEPSADESAEQEPVETDSDEGFEEDTETESSPEESTEEAQQEDESVSGEPDYDHFWDQYTDDIERKKAFHETKEYAARQSKKARELEEELKRLREAKPEAKPEPPTPPVDPQKRFEQKLALLHDTDSSVRERVEGLGKLKTYIATKTKEVQEANEALAKVSEEARETNATLKYLKGRLAADPDNLELASEVRSLETTLYKAELDQTKLEQKVFQGSTEIENRSNAYNYYMDELRGFVKERIREEDAQASEEQENKTLVSDAHSKWEKAFESVAEKHKIPEAERGSVNKILRALALSDIENIDVGEQISQEALASWMETTGLKPILSFRKTTSENQLKQYAKAKRKDSAQPAPKAPIKKDKDENSAPKTLDEVRREARRRMREITASFAPR